MWFRSLRNTVVQIRYDNGNCSRINIPSLLLTKVRSISLSSYVTVAQIQNPSSSSFVISYLINSGGLSENEAISASKKVHFETTSKPDSVLSLLESYGFSKSYISKLICKRPSILSSEPELAIKPKFDFFRTRGISGTDLAKFICSDPRLLAGSSIAQMIHVFDILKNIVYCDENVVAIIKRHPCILRDKQDIKKMMVNIEFLREEGVPHSNISKFLVSQPRALTLSTGRFKEIVEEIKGMGFNPYQMTYLMAIQVITAMSKLNRELKMDVYRRYGWSDEEIQNAFMIHPQCMITSEKKISSIMDYLVNQVGYSSSYIAQHTSIFCYSLEKRIIPRCSVYKILTSKGLVKNQILLSSLLVISDKSFLEKFVIKFEVEAPELLKLYPASVKSRAT